MKPVLPPINWLILALGMTVPVLGFAAPLEKEPANIAKVRKDFMATVEGHGECSLTYLDTAEAGHLIVTKCSGLPQQCLFIVHPTEALVAPLQCAPNPEFKPTTKI